MENIIAIIYAIIGCLYLIYIWHSYQKKVYNELIELGTLDSNMLSMYWLFMILFWPVDLIVKIIRKYLV